MLYSRLYSIEADISGSSSAISEARKNVASLDSATSSLPSRLSSIRGSGYLALGNLETDIELLSKSWSELAPSIKLTLANNVEPLTVQVNSLQSEARLLRSQINSGNIMNSQMSLSRLSTSASSLRSRVYTEANKVNSPIRELFSKVDNIDENMEIAEKTLAFFSQANFPLKEDESPILAYDGKILKGDKSEGTLYFTNYRFIFEVKKEVVLEKKFFIVTKKRTERTVSIDKPIGAIEEISKGRVGFLAWTGIYVRFKKSAGQEEIQFDVEGKEADNITKFFDYIIKGDADRDITKNRGTTKTENIQKRLIQCSKCYAPYTREVYRGQKTVQCEYCGAQILLE